MCRIGRLLILLGAIAFTPAAYAAGELVNSVIVVPNKIEAFVIRGLDDNQTYTHVFRNAGYTSAPIVICTSSFQSSAELAPVVRLDVTSSQVTVRAQRFDPVKLSAGNANVPLNQGNIFCFVATEGDHTNPVSGNFWFTAGKATVSTTHFSFATTYQAMNQAEKWDATEDVVVMSFSSPPVYSGVLSQIQTSYDLASQVSHTNDCQRYKEIPFTAYGGLYRLCVGRHVGRDHPLRADEDVGYIAFVSDEFELNTSDGFELTVKSDIALRSVNGVKSNGTQSVNAGYDLSFIVASQMAERGGDGSFVAVYGTDPFGGQSAQLQLEESTNADRTHTTENVAWLGMSITPIPRPSLSVVKDAYFSDDTPVPDNYQTQVGENLKYVYTITNTGNVPLSDILISDDHRGVGVLELQGCAFEINNDGSIWDTVAVKLTKLGVNDVAKCAATYEVTQADIDKQ